MLITIPHFIFALCSWFLLTGVLQMEDTGSLAKGALASSVGVARYGVPLLTAVISARLLSKHMNSFIFKAMPLVLSVLDYLGARAHESALAGIVLVAAFFLFGNFYEPVINVAIAKVAEQKKNYVRVNAFLNLLRTSARFTGSILVALLTAHKAGDVVFTGTSLLFIFLFLTLIPLKVVFGGAMILISAMVWSTFAIWRTHEV